MQIHNFNGENDYLIGLNWQTSTQSLSKFIHQLRVNSGFQFGITRKISYAGRRYYQAVFLDATYKNKSSAALLLAKALPDCFLIEEISEHDVWVCVIDHGMIRPGGDRIISKLELEEYLEELKSIPYAFGERTIHLNATDKVIEQIVNSTLASESFAVVHKGFLELTNDVSLSFLYKVNKQYDPRIIQAIIAIILLLCAGTIYLFIPTASTDLPIEEDDISRTAFDRLTKKLQEDNSKKLLAAKNEEKEWLQKTINKSHPTYLIARLIRAYNALPTSLVGYQLMSIQYQWKNIDLTMPPKTISASWQADSGNIKEFTQFLDTSKIRYTYITPSQVITTHNSLGNYERLSDDRVSGKQPLKMVNQSNIDFEGYFQHRSEYNTSIKKATEQMRPVAIDSVPSNVENTRQFKYQYWEFSITSNEIYRMADLSHFFDYYSYCTITEVTISKSGVWTMKGYIYENK